MPFTDSGCYYREIPTSPTYQKTEDSASGSDTWMIPWACAFSFANVIIPEPYELNGFTIKPVRWGFRYDASLKATSVDLTPWYNDEPGITGNSDASSWAKMKVAYKKPDTEEDEEDEDDPETFLTHKITIGAEMMTAPPSIKLGIADEEGGTSPGDVPSSNPDGTPFDPGDAQPGPGGGEEDEADADAAAAKKLATDENAPVTILLPTAEHQFTWKKVINPPFAAIYSKIGKVNSNTFLGAKPESLMFLGVDAQREFTTGEAKPWTLDYRFSHRVATPKNVFGNFGWNHFYIPKLGMWFRLQFNGQYAYESVDFNPIFGGQQVLGPPPVAP